MLSRIKDFFRSMKETEISNKEDLIKEIITDSHERKIISDDEEELLSSVFELEETTIDEIMIPRVDVKMVSHDMPLKGIIETMNTTGKSRLPVFHGKSDNIAGFVYAKDILNFFEYGKEIKAIEIVRTPYFVPESKSVLSTLREFQRNRISIAIVIDEYGGVSGLVTMEDIIEEIVGELQDELDKDESDYKKLDESTYLVNGRMDLDDFNEMFGTNFENEDVNSIGGYITADLGYFPRRNEILKMEQIDVRVVDTLKHRINRILVKTNPKKAEGNPDE